ncbi:MAG: tetratricopeptide repeat protein, partial [Burkholderiaceae bacterium]
ALPPSREANRFELQILIGMNRIAEITEPLRREITLTEPKERANAIASLPRLFARASDKKLSAQVVESALTDHINHPVHGAAAWTTIGTLRQHAGDNTGALQAVRRALALDPKAEDPVLLALSLIDPKQPAAEAIVRKHLEGKGRIEIRMNYARALLETQRQAEAGVQIHLITVEKPDFAPAWLVQGSLELQDNKLQAAEKTLLHYIALVSANPEGQSAAEKNRGLSQAYLLLAQVHEQRKDLVAAEAWLNRIENQDDLIRVQVRRAGILARQGKIDQARQLIRDLPGRNAEEIRSRLSSEIQLLRDHQQYQAAYDLLAQATARDSQDFDLWYDQAMMAEKLGRLDEMEKLLRLIMAGKPQFHHAYNALGYSFADRNIRLPEARQLILKALEFAPGDPFISDSLGWLEFRSGNPAEALRILQTAFKAKPDAEIAAHLGEVQWSLGQREQALATWRSGVQINAENETLRETLKRLRIPL